MSIKDWFKNEPEEIDTGKTIEDTLALVKDLNKSGLNRLIKGITLYWEAQNELKNIKTSAERENEKDAREAKPVDDIEKTIADSFVETEINE